MDADLVAFGDDAALLIGMEQGGDGRHVEGRRHVVPLQHLEDARHADAVAVLAPCHAADGFAALAHSLVSWSLSNEIAKAQRAPFFQVAGATARPART